MNALKQWELKAVCEQAARSKELSQPHLSSHFQRRRGPLHVYRWRHDTP